MLFAISDYLTKIVEIFFLFLNIFFGIVLAVVFSLPFLFRKRIYKLLKNRFYFYAVTVLFFTVVGTSLSDVILNFLKNINAVFDLAAIFISNKICLGNLIPCARIIIRYFLVRNFCYAQRTNDFHYTESIALSTYTSVFTAPEVKRTAFYMLS